VTALLVPMDTPGLTTNRFDCHGQRAIGRGSIFFENVRVPVSHRLGDENKGFVQVMHGFDFSRSLIGLQCLAVARVALDETWEYITQRQRRATGLLAGSVAERQGLAAFRRGGHGQVVGPQAGLRRDPPVPAVLWPRRLRPRLDGTAPARRARLPDRRRQFVPA